MMGISPEKLEGLMSTELFPFLRKPKQGFSGFLQHLLSQSQGHFQAPVLGMSNPDYLGLVKYKPYTTKFWNFS